MGLRIGSAGGGGGSSGGGGSVVTTKATHKTVLVGAMAEIAAADFEDGASVSVEHGLGETPDGIISYFEAVTADLGYAVGSRIPIQVPWSVVSSHDATHTHITCRSGDARFDIVNQSTGVKAKFAFARWKVVVNPYIFVDTQVVTNVSGGGGGVADSIFLGPDDEPTEEDWEAHKGKWTGRVVAPIDRDLIGGHGSVARFATINNDSATTGFGYEQLLRTTVYATMRAAIDYDLHYYWEWAAGQAVEVGDLVYRLSGGTEEYSICLRDHTTTAGNVADGSPDSSNQTGWITHSPAQVVNHANFAGIVGRLDTVDTTSLSHGNWVASIVNNFMSLWIWSATHSNWLDYFPASIGSLHESGYSDNAQAASEVRLFNSSAPDYYLIDGKFKILVFYFAPTAGAAVYYTNPVPPRDPVSYFYGSGQTERIPNTYPFTYVGTSTTVHQIGFADASDGPQEAFDDGDALGNIFVAAADVSTDIDTTTTDNYTVFSLPEGRYHLEVELQHDDHASGTQVFELKKIVSGTDDRVLRTTSAYTQISTALGRQGDLFFKYDDLVVAEGEQFYFIFVGIGDDNSRHFMRITRLI